MSQTYACYIHKRGVMTPELRILVCDRARDLADTILNELRGWEDLDKVEVFDADDQPIFSYAPGLQLAH